MGNESKHHEANALPTISVVSRPQVICAGALMHVEMRPVACHCVACCSDYRIIRATIQSFFFP